jgi:GAF domain-containing protein
VCAGGCPAECRDYEVGRIFTTAWTTEEQPQVVVHAVSAWAAWVLDGLMADVPYPYAGVLVPGPERPATRLHLVGERRDAGTGRPACGAGAGGSVAIAGTVCGSVFASGTPALVADVREHPDYAVAADSAMRSGLVVPVVRDGRPIAVINVESTRVGGLDITDLERVTKVAADAAAGAPSEVSDSAA